MNYEGERKRKTKIKQVNERFEERAKWLERMR
jgi:hypothetical protein